MVAKYAPAFNGGPLRFVGTPGMTRGLSIVAGRYKPGDNPEVGGTVIVEIGTIVSSTHKRLVWFNGQATDELEHHSIKQHNTRVGTRHRSTVYVCGCNL